MEATITAADVPSTRYLLLEIPPELRVIIYDFTFTMQQNGAMVDLARDPHPESKALCCTNKQIRGETYGIYKQALKSFWQLSHFRLTLDTFADCASIWSFREVDINHIKHITVAYNDQPRNNEWRLRDGGRSWALDSEWDGNRQWTEAMIAVPRWYDKMKFCQGRRSSRGPVYNITGDELAASEASMREACEKRPSLGAAPPLAKQLEFLSEFAAVRQPWYDEAWAEDEEWDFGLC